MVYAVLQGKRKPSLEAMVAVEKSLGVPIKEWLDITLYLSNIKKENLRIKRWQR